MSGFSKKKKNFLKEQVFACWPLFILLELEYAANRLLTVLGGYSPKQPYVLSSALCTILCVRIEFNRIVIQIDETLPFFPDILWTFISGLPPWLRIPQLKVCGWF